MAATAAWWCLKHHRRIFPTYSPTSLGGTFNEHIQLSKLGLDCQVGLFLVSWFHDTMVSWYRDTVVSWHHSLSAFKTFPNTLSSPFSLWS